MKNIPLLLMISAGLSAFPYLHAQEVDNGDVDRILAGIEVEADVPEVEVDEAVVEGMVDDEAVIEDVVAEVVTDDEVMMEEVIVDEAGDVEVIDEEIVVAAEDVSDENAPGMLPAINLDDVQNVDGDLEIRSSDDARSGLITLRYKEVVLADMVSILAQTANANIAIPEGLTEKVSGNLNDVFWRDALEVILSDKGYVLIERQSGIYTISSRDALAAEPLASETLDLKFITADAALPAIQSMVVSSNAMVIAIPETNVLVVSETPERIQRIKELLKVVDRPRKQVFIEAKFVELNDSAIQDLGINWQVLQGYTVRASGMEVVYDRFDNRSTQDAQALLTTKTVENVNTSTVTDGLPAVNSGISSFSNGQTDAVVKGQNFDSIDSDGSFTTVPSMEQIVNKTAVLSADDFALTLSALQQLDGTRIVSNPKMLVANGQTANIHVGRNEPNITATYVPNDGGGGNYVYALDAATPYLEIGVKLQVTPVISTDKNITINIQPELSRLIGEKSAGDAGLSYPITQTRRINTEFAVESGKTVAIGGLTSTEDKEAVNKVPLLGDIPIIGKYLFTHTSTTKVQDEIIIFVSVNSAHTETLDDDDGIPEMGSLIYTWLSHQETERAMKAEAALVNAGVIEPDVAAEETAN
ncbi:secretin N-terminal domain-containing protein [Kiritimatiellota bacterium B12222]|nr:secretin N-terminal domain-containing protein [Kiritimatiellota bacterium B12222]